MTINPQIFSKIKELKLPEQDSIYFCLMWWFKSLYPKADQLLFTETGNGQKVINLENEELYRTTFLRLEEGELGLRYPLFTKEKSNSFEEFTKKIAQTRLINSLGHVNNPQDYAVYDISKESREVFDQLPQLDLDKACQVVIKYYESAKPAQKFSNYLSKGFIVDYNQHE